MVDLRRKKEIRIIIRQIECFGSENFSGREAGFDGRYGYFIGLPKVMETLLSKHEHSSTKKHEASFAACSEKVLEILGRKAVKPS